MYKQKSALINNY